MGGGQQSSRVATGASYKGLRVPFHYAHIVANVTALSNCVNVKDLKTIYHTERLSIQAGYKDILAAFFCPSPIDTFQVKHAGAVLQAIRF